MTAPPFKVKAVYDYASPHDDDLSFAIGQIITVTEEEDADWYVGEYTDSSGVKKDGLFPRNFVEKYEPEAPPRPSRPRPKKDIATASEPVAEPADVSPPIAAPATVAVAQSPEVEQVPVQPAPIAQPEPPTPASPPPAPKPETAKPAVTAKPPEPPVAEKPSSFKDRIAAFNKAAEAPIAPIKPAQPASSSGFIKKPFVAPPPSRNAYVPPPTREIAPQKPYRREEDPEIAERQAQDLQDAERAGLMAAEGEEGEEEAAKPTSLRDRIALLQKQQQEQAARRAEIAAKEKPKRPTKKRTESTEQIPEPTPDDSADLEKTTSAESKQRQSIDATREIAKPPIGRRPSREPKVPPPSDVLSDGNEADQSGAGDTTEEADAESTEVDDSDEKPKARAPAPPPRTSTNLSRGGVAAEADPLAEEEEDEEDEEEEDEIDEETRRKMELRERMAKVSGGMGMPGMFAPSIPVAAPKKKRPSASSEQRQSVEPEPSRGSYSQAQAVPMVPMPMPRTHSPEPDDLGVQVEKEPELGAPMTVEKEPEYVPDVEDVEPRSPQSLRPEDRAAPPIPQERPVPPPPPPGERGAPPPIPTERPVPPPPPPESRPAPPPPPHQILQSPSAGSQADDEMALPQQSPIVPPSSPRVERDGYVRSAPPPVPGAPSVPQRPEGPRSPPASNAKRTSYVQEPTSPESPSVAGEKRSSRAPPPIPTPLASIAPSNESRPPPPPPPTAVPPARQSTGRESLGQPENDLPADRESDYEGDYDTDIASGVSHKNALKAHARDVSLAESTLSEEAPRSPPSAPPPIPGASPRAVPPPPPPHQPPPAARQSVETPRGAPPAPPTHDPLTPREGDAEYDPFRYDDPWHGKLPTHIKAPNFPIEGDDPLAGSTPFQPRPLDPEESQIPPPPPSAAPAPPPAPPQHSRDTTRDIQRSSTSARRSVEQPRASVEQQGQIAQEVDLSEGTVWWAQPNMPPPAFQNRADLLCEFEESSTSKRGGRTSVSKDVYVLFQDYSQTVINVRFDAKNPADATIEQRHEAPPARPRQDQLEEAHRQFGQKISAAAMGKQNQTVGDGTTQGLVLDLLRAQPGVLLPVSTRAYGALVYANMANATVQQNDEIRPGDIISFRNAKFSGKHGAMHAKYSEDVGKPDHVGVVVEWDGTKKKIRALEQGRESKKVKAEGFRVGDLRSGEVKVWRVMGRAWVGWES